MPWKETTHVSQRHEFVLLAQQEGADLSLLCRRFHVSRKTGYKWLKHFRQGGADGLRDRTRRPHASPARTPPAVEQQVLKLRAAHPAWGGRKLRARLLALGHDQTPAASTVTAILRRHGQLNADGAAPHKPLVRFEHAAPNELWQMDFKGYFPLAAGRCHPLTVLDDHSRFSLGVAACSDEQTETVRRALRDIFRRYGLPWRITCDNGAPWGHWRDGRGCLTQLGVWLVRLGVRLSHSRPHHPQTQGKDERFHRTLKLELLRDYAWRDVAECQTAFDRWRTTYNCERPHEALGLAVPASRYEPSCRPFPEELPAVEYAAGEVVRKVEASGQIKFERRHLFIGHGLRGMAVALRPTTTDGVLTVHFCHQRIMELDLRELPAQHS